MKNNNKCSRACGEKSGDYTSFHAEYRALSFYARKTSRNKLRRGICFNNSRFIYDKKKNKMVMANSKPCALCIGRTIPKMCKKLGISLRHMILCKSYTTLSS